MIDSWKDAYGQARGFLNQLPGQMKGNRDLLNEMMGVVRSGNIPSGVSDRLNAATKSRLQSSMGSMLNDMAGRRILNSSITSRGINDLSGAAADAFNRNYLNAYNSVLGGYGQGLQHSQSQMGNTLAALSAANGMLGNVNSGIGAMLAGHLNGCGLETVGGEYTRGHGRDITDRDAEIEAVRTLETALGDGETKSCENVHGASMMAELRAMK